jgi:hypothetical protein
MAVLVMLQAPRAHAVQDMEPVTLQELLIDNCPEGDVKSVTLGAVQVPEVDVFPSGAIPIEHAIPPSLPPPGIKKFFAKIHFPTIID